jgi:glycosyltransferase involved in cell wall biosynthesis
MMRILMPTIVDPVVNLGGAWASTRGVANLLRASPFNAEIVPVPPPGLSRTAHKLRRYVALAQSLLSARPAKFQFYYSRGMIASVKQNLQREFDLILLNGSDLLWLLPHLPVGMPRMLFAHNIEHFLYADQIGVHYTRRGLQKNLLLKDCARLRQHELAGMHQLGNVLFLSSDDESYARSEFPQLNTLTVPPLLNTVPAPRPARGNPNFAIEIGMLANFDWWPSQQGVRWFLQEVFPQLHSGVRLHLFGTGSQRVVTGHPDAPKRVYKHGFVPDLEAVWSTCDFMICPVFAGGGVSIKLAEAVCRGVPVLATHYATRGLPIDPDPAIVLRESAAEWIEFLNSDAARELGRLSPSPQIIARFRPEAYVEPMARFLRAVAAS